MTHEEVLTQTFVQLIDSLVDEFDLIDLLTVLADRCVQLVDVDAVGILLADTSGTLRVMAASSEKARLLELFQLQNDEGPCLEAFATGMPVVHNDLRLARDRWPRFSSEALNEGFGSVCALPLRVRSEVIGALNFFRHGHEPLPAADVSLAQALGDVASIAILQEQGSRELQLRAGRLQHALDSRVAIEQAKGMLAEFRQIDMMEAFDLLRHYSRSHNRQLTMVASDLIAGRLRAGDFAWPSPSNRSGPTP